MSFLKMSIAIKKALQEHQMINRPVSFYLALADAWLLVNEQQPVYQFRHPETSTTA